jgi:glucose/arabinose dehydrogenase
MQARASSYPGVLVQAVAVLVFASGCESPTPPPEVAAVDVAAPLDQLEVGKTLQLTATVRASRGDPLSGVEILWSSSDESVAAVSSTGVVTGRAPGSAEIRASVGGKVGTARLTVVPVPVHTVVVAPEAAPVLLGSTVRLTTTLRDARGAEVTGRKVAWSSGNETVATVAGDGTVTGRAEGTALITAESEGKKGTATITVVVPRAPDLRVEEVARGFPSMVTYLTAPRGDDRLFVVGRDGRVWIVQGGQTLPELFLDLRERVTIFGEGGLYSLAFHPRFASNGHFYVDYLGRDGIIRVERYTVSADRNRASPGSAKAILSIKASDAHLGGMLQFGPDGKLYISVGDTNSPAEAQNRGSLAGKVLRIDVDAGDPYAIPSDNPFVGEPGARGEVWATGLRNPWRLSIDAEAGLMYITDVGVKGREEVNVVPLDRPGLDFGWPVMEGSLCYPATAGCNRTGLTLPTLEYQHSDAPGGPDHPPGCSITGGFVYRGSRMPALRGHYFYGDFCFGYVRSFRYHNGKVTDQRQWPFPTMKNLTSFGQDGVGELYVLPGSNVLYRIAPES